MRMKPEPSKALERLREICLALPKANETVTWGHPTFRARKKTFAVFEEYKGVWCIAFKVEKEHQTLFLTDGRFFVTPYIGQRGWLSLKVERRLDWKEIKHLIVESYRLAELQR